MSSQDLTKNFKSEAEIFESKPVFNFSPYLLSGKMLNKTARKVRGYHRCPNQVQKVVSKRIRKKGEVTKCPHT
jgi:hypothetical protein